jgi:hypothetical protein
MPKKAMNYSNACVYKICCQDLKVTDVYVGSTTNLVKRRNLHKSVCNNESHKSYNTPVYQFIREYGGWNNWEVVKVQNVECNCNEDLLKLERECMERLGATLNKQVPSRSKGECHKSYYEEHKTERKAYYEEHKTEIAEKAKEKVTCQCGSIVVKSQMARHCRTIKHQKYLESLE